MRTSRAVATAIFLTAGATAANARAACEDPLRCICPVEADASAVGIIESVRTEPPQTGFPATSESFA